MQRKILYLGLDPSRFPIEGEITHFPIIRIKPRDPEDSEVVSAFSKIPFYSHLIFTSRTAVFLTCVYAERLGHSIKHCPSIVVGKATAASCYDNDLSVWKIAKQESAEGVINLLRSLQLEKPYIFFPHSSKSRPLIVNYLCENNIEYMSIDLYTPEINPLEVSFNVADFHCIVFTSPSTVHAFKTRFHEFPTNAAYHAIGHVTEMAIKEMFPKAVAKRL